MADYQSIFTGQEVDRAVQKLQNWAHAGFTAATTGTASSDTYDNITISGQTYAVLWKIAPTSTNQVYGIGLDSTTGRIYQIYNNKGTYSATALDANSDTRNTAGSTNSSSKLFLVGAGSQATYTQTYSDINTYVTNGTLTTNSLSLNGSISYRGTNATSNIIKFKDNTSDAYGNGIAIGGGGIVIVGAGESSDLSYGSAGDENLYLAADTGIHFYSNAQDGLTSAKHMTFDNSGALAVPGTITSNGVAVALENHTHTTTIAEDSGTNQLTLGYNKKYKLTTGGTSFIFTMPASDDQDTKNTAGATNSESKLFLVGSGSQATYAQTYTQSKIYETAGTLNATKYSVAENATIQYNSTSGCLEIIC